MQTPRGYRTRGTQNNTRVRSAAKTRGASPKGKNLLSHLRLILMIVCAVCLALFVVLLIIKDKYVNKPAAKDLGVVLDDGKFFEGITIDGTDIGGLDYEAARAKLLPSVSEKLKSVNIHVVHGTSLWILNAVDMGIGSTLDSVLQEAMLFGRSGTKAENEDALNELSEHGKSYSVSFIPNDDALKRKISVISATVGTQPVEPYAEADTWSAVPTFVYHEGVAGHTIDEASLVESIKKCLSDKDYSAVIDPELTLTPPAHDIEWIKQNTQLRAQWQTDFGTSSSLRNANRVGNIQKASTILNGACVAVGEEFNFNAFIGPRTEAGGWPLAPGIVNGNSYEMQAGGGICQVSTTLYNALLCAGEGIEITERYHHSWPSSYADYGLDSTVTGSAESGKSLNFINNTGAPLYIFAFCDQENKKMNIYLYGEPLEAGVSYKTRGETIETVEPGEPVVTENPDWPTGYEETTVKSRKGYKAEAYRDKYINGEFSDGQYLYTDSYRAVTAQITRGTGDPSLPKPEKPKS